MSIIIPGSWWKPKMLSKEWTSSRLTILKPVISEFSYVVFLSQHIEKTFKKAMEAYKLKAADTFKGYLFPKEWYEVSPANGWWWWWWLWWWWWWWW